jgi:drug/metabolite transporter (DMT)-like permease
MGVVAPVTAVAAGGIPLMVGVLTEGLPAWPQVAGFLLALLAIWIISRPDALGSIGLRDLALPLLAGVGFGVFLALIGRVGDERSFVWPLVAARVASMTMLGIWVVARRLGEPAGPIPWPLAAVAGLGDTAGNAFFVLAAAFGRLDVAGVLGALYPAATVVLARIVLGERLTRAQRAGVGLALAAVVLIAV